MEIPMQPVSKEVREFIRAIDVLLKEINENGNFNTFEKVLLASYANRLNAANTLLQSRALRREAQELHQEHDEPVSQPVFKPIDADSERGISPLPRESSSR
jgi:hypothetical protein